MILEVILAFIYFFYHLTQKLIFVKIGVNFKYNYLMDSDMM
jgi:hypothetical protein